MSDPQIIVLDNGLRLVHLHRPGVFAGIFGITVAAGSASESASEHGLAHLVEHNIFKGTAKRRSWHITNRIESDGGELNAFTTKEETTVYAIFPAGNPKRPIELIADLAINSVFPAAELDKEREVVIDEINSYRDTPMDAVYDDFEDMVYAGSPLGHNILGTPDSVRSLDSEACCHFLRRHYTVASSVLFYSGPDSADTVRRTACRYFAALPAGTPSGTTPESRPTEYRHVSDSIAIDGLHQSHTVVGMPIGSIYDNSRYGDALFSNIIGGPGMNSLLNVELRERRGLVYTVEASVARFTTTGLLTVYYGCDADDTDRCLNLVRRTARRLADTPEPALARLLARGIKQYCGQLSIAAENYESRIMNAARSVLFNGTLSDLRHTISRLEAVTPEFIRRRADELARADFLTYHP
ncbi:MAG: insulinase family protein [Muribaculaceae bacterium]|nr:insulinase family protein [Muribaculaceae bacterium]